MSTLYEGKHSALFLNDAQFAELKSSGYKTLHNHTWEDWHLIPSSRPVIATPKIKEKNIDIPGAYGKIDLSEVLTGYVLYDNRSGSLNFLVDNDHVNWTTEHEMLAQALHGRRLKMILLDDMEFYYEGRFSLNEWKSDPERSTIVINYDLEPFKHPIYSSDEDWLWDPFDFEKGVIRTIKDETVDGTREILCPNGGQNGITPTINCSSAMIVVYNGGTYNLPAGESSMITLTSGDTYMTFTGNGTVSITYRGGYL